MSSTNPKECLHNTPQGLTWKRAITKRKFFGLYTYIIIEKECNACGVIFQADEKGRRLKSKK